MKLKFTKMHGCGNDYIYFNCFTQQIDDPCALSVRLSDRRKSIGGDGVILVCPSKVADAKMRIFNADGSEAKMCGNGVRCVAKFIVDENLVPADTPSVSIETLSGVKKIDLLREGGKVVGAVVDMEQAILEPEKIPVNLPGEKIVARPTEIAGEVWSITCVSMGNPHCVVFVDDVDSLDLEKIGPQFEKNSLFPEQVNTEFIKVLDETALQMRVWERGSGETWACGTGACAAVVAAIENDYCKKNQEVTVHLVGGDLNVRQTEETVFMTGEAVSAFEGEVLA